MCSGLQQGEALRQSLLTRYYGKHSLNRQDSTYGSLSLRGSGSREDRGADVIPQRSEMKIQEVQVTVCHVKYRLIEDFFFSVCGL